MLLGIINSELFQSHKLHLLSHLASFHFAFSFHSHRPTVDLHKMVLGRMGVNEEGWWMGAEGCVKERKQKMMAWNAVGLSIFLSLYFSLCVNSASQF